MTTDALVSGPDISARAALIAETVAAPFAEDVDRLARFPDETVEALKSERLLSALVPVHLGGAGATVPDVAAAVFSLARHCASSAMVYAMHSVEVACLARHGGTPEIEEFLRELVHDQLLVASATTEIGTGGDVGRSACAVEREGDHCRLEKQAPVISYGAEADAILVTARRTPESSPTDQVMVLCTVDHTALDPLTEWDAMGFRGTCSSGFRIRWEGGEGSVLPVGFEAISSQTNVPVSHILWSHVWLGLAAEALHRTRVYVQAEARKHPGTVPSSALRLAELDTRYRQMAALVRYEADRFDRFQDSPSVLESLGYAIGMNALKVAASTLAAEVVHMALGICGMAGYRETSPFGMGRLLRDAHGAALMLNNDRLLRANAHLLLIDKSAP